MAGGKKTHRGFEVANVTPKRVETPPRGVSIVPLARDEAPPKNEFPLDIEYIREAGTPALLGGPWTALEIWTQNRIYSLDSTMVCIQVRDRSTGESNKEHAVVGATLLGGQRRDKSGAISQVSHPIPRPGASAVFSRGVGRRLEVSETSPVTRVALRLRVVDVSAEQPAPEWDEITGR